MKIRLHYKNGEEYLANLLDTQKLALIEFELNIKQCTTTEEIVNYIKQLDQQKKIYAQYNHYTEFNNTLLIYLTDGYGNKKFLEIER